MCKYFQLIEIFSAKLLGNQILKTYAYINKGIGTYNIYVYACMCVCMYMKEKQKETEIEREIYETPRWQKGTMCCARIGINSKTNKQKIA